MPCTPPRPDLAVREPQRVLAAAQTALAALKGYLDGESGLPFTDPYCAARTAAEALHDALYGAASEGHRP